MPKFRLRLLFVLIQGALLASGAVAKDVLIYNGDYSDVANNLASRQTAAGNTPTVISWSGGSLAALPTSLSGYSQLWDVNGHLALTAAQQTAYLSYLQGGGALFLMGENTGYGAQRNATLVSFIQAAGGGTVAIVSNSGSAETVSSTLQTPNSISSVSYAASGSYTNAGNGICLTQNSSSSCSAIAFNVGNLTNARQGSLVSVLDINFLESSRSANFQAFVDNLIAYMAAQSEISAGRSGLVPKSTNVSTGAATVLDQLAVARTIDVNMAAAIGQISSQSSAQQTVTLQHLVPESSQAQSAAATQTVSGALDTVQIRLEGIRSNEFTVGMADQLASGKVKVASSGDLSGLFTESSRRHSFWSKAFGSRANQDSKEGYAGYRADTWGLAFGTDTLLENEWVIGGAFAYANTGVNMSDLRRGDSTDIKTYQLTTYTSRDFGHWYLDGMLGYAVQKYDSRRDTTVSGIAQGSFDGQQLALRFTAGYPLNIRENLTLTPTAGLEYIHLKQDSYTETGADALSLTVNGRSADRLGSVLGAKLATQLNTAGNYTVSPSVHVSWRHQFDDNGMDTTSSFTGGGASFVTPGQKLARDSYDLGAAVSIRKSKDFSFSLRLDGERASGYHSVAGQALAQWLF